ncbi:MAG: GerMN domain-containing protein, partial [Butyrivibrio sp.]|nr:GerMN domain-containing protein [Butyrivibrio sp.]
MKNRILFSFTKSVKRIMTVSMAAVLALALFGCVPARPEDANVFELYFVNNAETGVVAVDYEIQSNLSDTEDVVEEVIEQLSTEPERRQYQAPISQGVSLMDYSIADKLLTLNFDNKYYEIRRTAEILDRAAIVRTFTQLEEVEYVSFQVEGSPLLDHNGNIVGNMSADMFIYNMGHEISTYEKIELKLYFANETRDKLVPVYRSVVYNSN